jgi:hypothetical protein
MPDLNSVPLSPPSLHPTVQPRLEPLSQDFDESLLSGTLGSDTQVQMPESRPSELLNPQAASYANVNAAAIREAIRDRDLTQIRLHPSTVILLHRLGGESAANDRNANQYITHLRRQPAPSHATTILSDLERLISHHNQPNGHSYQHTNGTT